jgi:hypothetical protein
MPPLETLNGTDLRMIAAITERAPVMSDTAI